MTQSPSAKAPPRPFLAAAPEPRALAARLRDLAAQPGASPFEALTPPDWARLGFAARSEAERIAFLEASVRLLERRPDLEVFHKHGVAYRRRAVEECKVAALFSDEELVHPGMGSALTAAFPGAARMARGFDAIFEGLGHPTLTQTLWGADPRLDARLRLPIYAQLGAAALAAGQYALLAAGGFVPDMVAGYGSGELTALWAAEALDDEALGALLYARGGAMSAPDPRRPSGNLRVFARVERSLDLIEESGLRVFVTRIEAPERHALGGDVEALEAFSARLLGRGIEHLTLSGGVSWHSGRAEVAAAAFAGALRRARLDEPRIPFHDGEASGFAAPEEIAGLLERRLLKPLRFQEAIERMHAEGVRIFVEFGPGDGLAQCVREILGDREHMIVSMDDGDPELSALRAMEAAAALAAAGVRFKGEKPPLPAPPPAQTQAQAQAPAAPLPEPAPPEAEIAPEPEPEAPRAAAGEPQPTPPLEDEEEPPPATNLLAAAMAEEAVLAAALARREAALQSPEPVEAEAQEPEEEPEPEALAEAQEPEAQEPEAQEPEEAALSEEPPAEPEAQEEAQETEAAAPPEPEPQPAVAFDSAPEAPIPVGFAEALSEAAPEALPPAPAAPASTPEPVALEVPAAPSAPPEPLTGAALALRLAEQVTAAHERFLEGQAEALRALLEAAADPEAVFAIEEARRESAEAHRLYLEAVAALGGARPRLSANPPAPPSLAALAAQEADWPAAPEAADELPYSDPPERCRIELEEEVEEAVLILDVKTEPVSGVEKAETVALAEEAEAVESVEEAEAVALVEEAEAVESLEEAEAVALVEEAEAVASLEEAEAVASLEEAEAVESVEETEAVESVEEAEAVDLVEEAEAVDLVEEAEAVDLVEEAEAVDLVEEAEAVDLVEEAEAVDLAEEAEAVDLVEEAEAVDLVEEAEAVESLEEAEAVELAEEAEAVERVEEAEAPAFVANLPAVLRKPPELVSLAKAGKSGSGAAEEAAEDEQPFPRLTRRAFRLAPIVAPRLRPLHPGDSRWLVVGDPPLAAALVDALQAKAGAEPFSAVAVPADAGAYAAFRDGEGWTGLVYLHAEGEEEQVALGRLELARGLVEAAQESFHAAAARGERRLFAAVARLDGRMGYGASAGGLGAAGFGLAKALAAAEPNLFCRAVDLAAALPLDQAAAALAEDLLDADRSRVETAVDARGRFEIRAFEEPAPQAPVEEEEDEIFVLIGDARGVATLWLEETAARARRRFLILGEHRLLADEPEWAVGLQSEETLRWAAFQALEKEGADEDRAALGAVALSEAVTADRETRACLAELRRLGSEAAYATIDFASPEAADQIAAHMAETGEGPVSVFYAPPTDPQTSFSEALARRMRRVEILLDGFSGADLRRLWFLPPPLDETESLSETMADEAVRRFAMGARALGIDVRSLLWAVAEEIEPGLVGALAAELRRPPSEMGMAMIGGAETPLSLRRVEPGALAAGAALRADWSALFEAAAPEGRRPVVLPAAFAMAAAFAAVERFAPGWRAEGCDGAALAQGLALGEEASTWVALGLRSSVWLDEATLRADLEIFDLSGRARLRIEGARFSQRPPPRAEDPPEGWPEISEPQDSVESFYAEKLPPHGLEARLLTACDMPERAEEGVFGAELPRALERERSALLDPALVEAMIHGALAAARRRSGRRGLPLRLEAFSVWSAPEADPESGGLVLIEASLKRETEKAAIWRLLARDPDGAPLLGFEAAVILEASGAQTPLPAQSA